VVYRAAYSDYFHTDMKVFPAIEFPLEVLQHMPDSHSRLLRIGPPDEPQPELSVSAKHSRAAWARLIKKVYEADPLTCPRGHNPMNLIAVITERQASHPPVWIPPPSTDLLSVSPKG
jgi:hypothetical protein